MKASKYNHIVENKGISYLYNVLSTAIIELDERCVNLIKNSEFEKFSADESEFLAKNRIIVDDDIDETEEYLYHYNYVRFNRCSRVLALIFVPTYNCNLACPYCIQGGNKPIAKMSRSQIDSVLQFVKIQIKEKGVEHIHCSLFGGEPMMVKPDLAYFSEKMSVIAKENNCEIDYNLTSNFTLLDDSMIELIRKYNIMVQVSIDGVKQDHDKRRVTHNNKGTYDIIIGNLKRMNEEGLRNNLNIRLNVDVDNLGTAKEMLEAVVSYSDNVYYGLLSHNKEKNDKFESSCLSECDYAKVNATVLDKLLRDNGILAPRHFGKELSCSLNSESKFIVDNKLNVYKCELFIGREEAKSGHIESDGSFVPNGNFYHQMNHSPAKFKECLDCKLLPLCAGGCVAKSNINKGKDIYKLTEKNCMFTEADLDVYLKDYIDNCLG